MSSSAAGERRTGLLLLLATAVIWGVNWPVMKFALSEIPPFTFRGYAGIGGAALAFLAARAAGERPRLPASQAPRLVLLALLNITGWMALNTEALLWLPASEAVILAYTMPIWSALLAWPVLGERPGPARTGGLLIGMLGCAVLVAGQPLGASRGQ
ncbi:MAG: DMT family transporter, partial [Acetobacteraceae bacterium]|nr:DMT family transporter [Acetobacteraceae bacterium]